MADSPVPARIVAAPDLDCLMACPGCDLLLEEVPLEPGQVARCPRCDTRLRIPRRNTISNTLAMSASGLLLYLPAILLPLMTLDTIGMKESASIVDGVIGFYRQGYLLVALIVLLTSVLFPLVKLSLIFAISVLLKLGRFPRGFARGFRLFCHLDEWGMVEVYLIGILVTIIKIYGMAHITYGTGFFCFIGLVLATVGITLVLDEHVFWRMIEGRGSEDEAAHRPSCSGRQHPLAGRTALSAGLVQCHDCHKLMPWVEAAPDEIVLCPRCGARLHPRKTDSLARTWALVATSLILFVPANVLPIMQVETLGSPENSTIMDGIIYFFKEGSYGIGVVILTASILVPLFKILGMTVILLSIRYRWKSWLRHKTWMFRFIEFIGRWSMLDIYVIALLGVLIDFGLLSAIHPAPAATYFAAVVLCTMFAAISFDSRILWDHCAA